MKINAISAITCLLVLIGFNNPAFSTESTPAEIALNYYEACKTGDVSTMKSLIADHFYQRRRVLIEENAEYPNFLKSRYSEVQIQVVSSEVENANGNAAVTVQQILPDGTITYLTLLLKKSVDGIWKISDEMLPH